MGMWYRHFQNDVAFSVLAKPAMIPDFKLMVGSAEYLPSMPAMVFKNAIPPQAEALIRPMQDMSAEQLAPDLSGVTWTPNDFIYNDFFFGDPTGS